MCVLARDNDTFYTHCSIFIIINPYYVCIGIFLLQMSASLVYNNYDLDSSFILQFVLIAALVSQSKRSVERHGLICSSCMVTGSCCFFLFNDKSFCDKQ